MVEIFLKYIDYLRINNRKPALGDKIYCVFLGNFAEHEIANINEVGWIYINKNWLISTDLSNLYIKTTANRNCL